jgi:hypothetical protein
MGSQAAASCSRLLLLLHPATTAIFFSTKKFLASILQNRSRTEAEEVLISM